MTIAQAKQLDIVAYLSALGFQPEKIRGNNYWYQSPLRNEHTGSFKVNTMLNRWYDFGDGRGGNLVDFGILYHHCEVRSFLQMLIRGQVQPNKYALYDNAVVYNKMPALIINKVGNIVHPALKTYLSSRKIPLHIARYYLHQVHFICKGNNGFALGFQNDSSGFELRNKFGKLTSAPKDVRLFDNGSSSLVVFEGFFDFLSYLTLQLRRPLQSGNYLILNSTSFFEKSLPVMLNHEQVYLYLDNDATGQKCSQHAITLDKEKFIDQRHLYQNFNDLNDWLRYGSP